MAPHVDQLRIDLLLRSGALHGPYRRAKPITVSLWQRALRAVRRLLINRKGPL